MKTKEAIRQQARELGFDACRFTTAAAPETAERFRRWLASGRHGELTYLERNASRRMDPQQVLPGARSVIVLAASYLTPQPPAESAAGPTADVARYARFRDYHAVLGERLKTLAACVDQAGGPESHSLWYVDTGPVLERDLGQRAGLGFIGKHTNLISRQLGNWFFLAEILTTVALEPDAPERNRCGTCTRCLSACPTRAIVAPFELDARRCISYLTIEFRGSIPSELRTAMGARVFGCDDCLAVCPWNRFAQAGRLMAAHFRRELAGLDLISLLGCDEATFKHRFVGTPILRTKRRGLLRNVCVALGNVGDASALPALEQAAGGADELIAEHARWAIGQVRAREAAVRNRAFGGTET